jgi:hypothetical protein
MRHWTGLILQVAALTLLPSIIVFQLFFGFPLIVMPACLTLGIGVFWLGTKLRESQ